MDCNETDTGRDEDDAKLKHFRIGPHTYDGDDDAAIFTLPLADVINLKFAFIFHNFTVLSLKKNKQDNVF